MNYEQIKEANEAINTLDFIATIQFGGRKASIKLKTTGALGTPHHDATTAESPHLLRALYDHAASTLIRLGVTP